MIDHLNHLVLTIVDVEAGKRFYAMQLETFGEGQLA
jgi:hypothetical protein